MKNAITFARILLVVMIAVSCHGRGILREVGERLMTCMKKLDISVEEYLKNDRSIAKFHCWNHCIMSQAGFIDGRKIDFEKMIEKIQSHGKDVYDRSGFEKAHGRCMEKAHLGEDECVVARLYAQCMIKYSHEVFERF